MTWPVTHEDGHQVLWLAGEIDATNAPTLTQQLRALTAPIVVDLTAVDFMDSSGLGALALAARHGAVTIRNPQKGVARILRIAGLDKVLGYHG